MDTNALMEKIRKQKEALDARPRGGSGTPRVKFWQAKKYRSNPIRIMPPWASEGFFADQPWRKVGQHWNVSPDQRGPVLCPENTENIEGKCPVCAVVKQLKAMKSDPEALQIAKDIRAKDAWLLNIVDLEDPSYTVGDIEDFKTNNPEASEVPYEVGQTKIQVYAASVTAWEPIIGTMLKNQINPMDLKTGHDVDVETKKGKKYTEYVIDISFKPSVFELSDDAVLNNLEEVGYLMEDEKMLELLSTGVAGDYVAGVLPEDASPDDDESQESVDDLEEKMKQRMGKAS